VIAQLLATLSTLPPITVHGLALTLFVAVVELGACVWALVLRIS